MDALYYIALAVLIATVGITLAVGKALDQMKEEQDESKLPLYQTHMFIRVAIVEAIPIVLVVLCFMNLEQSTTGKAVPVIIALGSTLLSMYALFMKYKNLGIEKEERTEGAPTYPLRKSEIVKITYIIGNALILSLPIISFVVFMIRP